MDYFNLMEVIVADVVDEVLGRDDSLDIIKFHRNDIIAYALNRIPARYVTSERGVIHGRIDTRLKFQQHTDVLFLIYEAIEIFTGRRDSELAEDHSSSWRQGLIPHLIGEVLEESTLSVIPDIKVSLLYGDTPVPMMDDNWNNPYLTSEATRGYYHFWPDLDEKIDIDQDEIKFSVKFEHPDFEEMSVPALVILNEKKDIGKTFSIPLVLLKLKEGVDPGFLTDQIF